MAGFHRIVEEIVAFGRRGLSLGEVARFATTLGERLPPRLALRPLVARELAVLERCSGHGVESHPGGPPVRAWCIGIWGFGRFFAGPAAPTHPDFHLIGWVCLTEAEDAQVLERAAQLDAADRPALLETEQFFASKSEGEQRQVLEQVFAGLDHIDQVLYYLGDQTLTNLQGFNNLLNRNKPGDTAYVLPALFHKPIEHWDFGERQLVHCVHLLLEAGMRGEEFNGMQLTSATVQRYFAEKRAEYYATLGEEPPEPSPRSLEAQAAELAHLRTRLLADYSLTRWVHGLTFYKEEHWRPRRLSAKPPPLPAALVAHLARTFGVAPDDHAPSFLAACVDAAPGMEGLTADGAPVNAIEYLVVQLIESAQSHTRSDVSMSRGLRNLAAWQRAVLDERHRELCDWSISHYFCAVTAGPGYARAVTSMLAKTLTAIARRMQYNSWHYMPSHVPVDQVPPGRHFFYAPKMADLTEWSDQHHEGHTFAQVRHAIRVPAPLVFRERVFNGMVDLRLMRHEGGPYTREELEVALRFTEYLRIVYQRLSDRVANDGWTLPVTAFTTPWYDRHAAGLLRRYGVGPGVEVPSAGAARLEPDWT